MFTTIYEWFISFFGGDMADYLFGKNCETGEFDGSNQYNMYGFIALGIALGVVLVYYYVINHPRFSKWWSWLLMLLLVGVSNLVIGGAMTIADLNAGNIGDCLLNGENGGVDATICWMFGLADGIVSILFFSIFSIAFKWWSTNCKMTPF
jgi:hypothetical protein